MSGIEKKLKLNFQTKEVKTQVDLTKIGYCERDDDNKMIQCGS